jgi:hypothetical protein
VQERYQVSFKHSARDSTDKEYEILENLAGFDWVDTNEMIQRLLEVPDDYKALITQDAVDKTLTGGIARGQIAMFNAKIFPGLGHESIKIVSKEGQTYQDYLYENVLVKAGDYYDPSVVTQSSICDTIFENLVGETSMITLFRSETSFINSDSSVRSVINNYSPTGTNIHIAESLVLIMRINFYMNSGWSGGVFSLVNGRLFIIDSVLDQNLAYQGGVLFAISKSGTIFEDCKMSKNLADDGAIVYALANQDRDDRGFIINRC